jgi:hypothetical protein
MGPQINIPAPAAVTHTPTAKPLYFSKAYPIQMKYSYQVLNYTGRQINGIFNNLNYSTAVNFIWRKSEKTNKPD